MAKNQPLHDLWQQFQTKYAPERFKFGYRNRELFYSLSVQDERSGRAKISQAEIGLPVIEYGKIWKQLMVGLGYSVPAPRAPGNEVASVQRLSSAPGIAGDATDEQEQTSDESEQAGEPSGDSQAEQSGETS